MKDRTGDVLGGRGIASAFSKVVEGRPLEVQGRVLVPLVRVTSWVKRRAVLQGEEVGAQGYGFGLMEPVGLVEREGVTERRHTIQDETTRTLRALAVAALLVPCVAMLLMYLSSRARRGRATTESA